VVSPTSKADREGRRCRPPHADDSPRRTTPRRDPRLNTALITERGIGPPARRLLGLFPEERGGLQREGLTAVGVGGIALHAPTCAEWRELMHPVAAPDKISTTGRRAP
jgi:hypothetical protein